MSLRSKPASINLTVSRDAGMRGQTRIGGVMTISATTTVREVVVTLPQSTRVFEKLKIDYCCGGGTPLIEACTNAGVEFQQLEKMLEQVKSSEQQTGDQIDFSSTPLTVLIGHILEKHHVFTKEEMVRLEPLFAKVVSAHGENHPELHSTTIVHEIVRRLESAHVQRGADSVSVC
jgi:regulator of cell morphogenesis and NO signaling